MRVLETLQLRGGNACELCGAASGLSVVAVAPHDDGAADTAILACAVCAKQMDGADALDIHHWRCLSKSMWNTNAAVQVSAWRMLEKLKAQDWARDLSEMLYLEDHVLAWAKMGEEPKDAEQVVHKDTFGAVLAMGDMVTLVKDLKVKGAGFTAKRGTAVRNISLVADNAAHIEGRVEGQQIVILTEFVKKAAAKKNN